MADLLPCPFCGSPASYMYGPISNCHYVNCDDDSCGTNGPNGVDEQSAISAWNRRAQPADHIVDANKKVQPAGGSVRGAIARMDECRAACDVGEPFYADVEAWDVIRSALAAPVQPVVDGWPRGALNREKTLKVLREHNAWRRGAEGEQTDPRMLGLALDAAIEALTAQPGEVKL